MTYSLLFTSLVARFPDTRISIGVETCTLRSGGCETEWNAHLNGKLYTAPNADLLWSAVITGEADEGDRRPVAVACALVDPGALQ